MRKKILKIIAFLTLAMAGAALFQLVLVPFLVANPFFSKFELIKNLKREVVVNPVEQFIIKEDGALKKAISQVEGTVLKITSLRATSDKKFEGCGFSLTSDGLIITTLSLIDQEQNFILLNDQQKEFRLSDEDLKNDLALIKTEARNLKTVSFADFGKIKPGEQIFLMGINLVNQGIIKILSEDLITTNILENKSFENCPMFNLEAQFVGLAKIILTKQTDEIGQLFILPAPQIRSFSGI